MCASHSGLRGRQSPNGGDSDTDRLPLGGAFAGERLLVPLLDPTAPAVVDQLKVAATLARATGAAMRILGSVRSPERFLRRIRPEVPEPANNELLRWALEEATVSTLGGGGDLLPARRIVRGIHRSVDAHGVDTLVLPGESAGGGLTDAVGSLERQADCDAVIVNGRPGYDPVPSILLPIAGGPHSGVAADVAASVAAEHGAWVDVLHVVGPESSERRGERYVEAAYRRVGRPDTTTRWLLESDDPAATIAEQSRYYGLTVIGAPTTGRLRRFVRGSTNRTVREDARSVVLSVRNNRTPAPASATGALVRV